MPKVILTDVTNLGGNPVSSQQVINTNSDRIEAAIEKTLSRDGTSPNQMEADFDMNHYKILNVKDLQLDGLDGLGIVEAIIRERIERILGDLALASLIGQAGAIEVPVFDSTLSLGFATVKSTINSVRTGGYREVNDGGGALYYRKNPLEQSKPGDVTSNSGTVRWGLINQTVNVKQFGATGDGVTDDTLAIRQALAFGRRLEFPYGQYVVTDELEVVTPGQVIYFQETMGYGYGENVGLMWDKNCRIIARGTFPKRIRTRRLFRGSASDPQDAPISCVFNIQAEGVQLWRPDIWLDCDYTDMSPTNRGADCDVGIFIGTRVGVQIHDPQIIGYFRRLGIWEDITNATALPRFKDLSGTPYPTGTVLNGSDGLHIYNPYIRGSAYAFGRMGSRPKVGQTGYSDPYYDQELGTTVPDARGSFGGSDLLILGGRLYGPDHHSNWRIWDPTPIGGVLSEASLNAEPDFGAGVIYIDGMAGNASGNIWGMRLLGTRIATFEAFRIRIDGGSRLSLIGCHIEGRGGSGVNQRYSSTGVAINPNDYVATSYGDIAGTARSDRVTVFGSVRQSYADGLAPHFYGSGGKPYLVTDSGRVFIPAYMVAATDFDLRTEGNGSFIFRNGTITKATIRDNGLLLQGSSASVIASSGELDLRSASGSGTRVRTGSVTTLLIPASGIYNNTTASAANVYVGETNTLARSTSSGRFKTDVEDLDEERASDIVSGLRPVWYRSLCDLDKKEWSWYGLIAEEVAEVDPRFVQWKTDETTYEDREVTEDMEVESIDEDGVVTVQTVEVTSVKQVPVTRRLDKPVPDGVMYDRIVVALITKIQELEGRLQKLEG